MKPRNFRGILIRDKDAGKYASVHHNRASAFANKHCLIGNEGFHDKLEFLRKYLAADHCRVFIWVSVPLHNISCGTFDQHLFPYTSALAKGPEKLPTTPCCGGVIDARNSKLNFESVINVISHKDDLVFGDISLRQQF